MADETGVDGGPDLEAPLSAGQRVERQNAEEPETGALSHSHIQLISQYKCFYKE